MKDRSKVTVTAEMHQETPRHPSVERKQRIPVQMIKTQGRFLMQMADIPVNVEVISSNAKQALVSSVASGIIAKVRAEKEFKHPLQKKQNDDNGNANDPQVDQQVNKQVDPKDKDKECLSRAMSYVKWMVDKLSLKQCSIGFEHDDFVQKMVGKAKDIKTKMK